MQKAFIIFPNTLFEDVDIMGTRVFLVEDPSYFRKNTNKVKLAYMRGCMKYYEEYLRKKGKDVTYVDYSKTGQYTFLRKFELECYDPCDYELQNRFKLLGLNLRVLESPMFLANKELLETYHTKATKKANLSNADFYNFMKNKLDIFKDVKSYDAMNRKSLPNGKYDQSNQVYASHYMNEAVSYINKHPQFKHNIGNLENIQYYPMTFEQARKQLDYFLKTRLIHFGDYQDAILFDEVQLYHSCLSCCLNNGLITPKEVLSKTIGYWEKHKTVVMLNNVEGFVRQLLGWREYTHYLYKYYHGELMQSNHWDAQRRIKDWKPWLEGRTGISTLDHEIKKCVSYAYSHHIVRLMMFLNVFVLCEVHPHDVVTWFMDVCAIDAYPWVMWSNIIAMGWFSPRFMKKPYISTERYILNMSNMKKKECFYWKSLFYAFLMKNKQKLVGTSRVYLRNLSVVEKNSELARIYEATAKSFISKLGLQ